MPNIWVRQVFRKVVAIFVVSAAAMLGGAGRSNACEWVRSDVLGCYRIDVYSCPVYVYVDGVLIHIGCAEIDDPVLAYCGWA